MYPNSIYFGLKVIPIYRYFGAKVYAIWVHGPKKLLKPFRRAHVELYTGNVGARRVTNSSLKVPACTYPKTPSIQIVPTLGTKVYK